MRRILLIAVFIAVFFGTAMAQTQLRLETLKTYSKWPSFYVVNMVCRIDSINNSKLGSFIWLLSTSQRSYWSKGYTGLTYTISSWSQIGLGIGLKDQNNPWRVGSSIQFAYNKWFLTTLLEYDNGKLLPCIFFNYSPKSNFGIGLTGDPTHNRFLLNLKFDF